MSDSESVEMYLKSVAELGGEHEPVPIGRVAERLGIVPGSANQMMKVLGEQGLIDHQPYKGVTLTAKGQRRANSVIRRQRLWECFLVDHLKLDWAQAYDMACDLEHATSSEVTEALAGYLNHPAICPHGNPIPDADGKMVTPSTLPLARLAVGQSGRMVAIAPENGEILTYLDERGLRPGFEVTVVEAAPLQGPLTLRMESGEVVLGLGLAELVLVEIMDESVSG